MIEFLEHAKKYELKDRFISFKKIYCQKNLLYLGNKKRIEEVYRNDWYVENEIRSA